MQVESSCSSYSETLLVNDGIRITGSHLSRGAQQRVQRLQRRQGRSALLQSRNYFFGRDVADQRILREGAATQSSQCGIKAPATRVVGSQNLCFRMLGAAVQMYSDLQIIVLIDYRANEFTDLLWSSHAHGIGQRNHLH